MKAVILAAGVGARLGEGEDHPPKAMLEFGGKSLLQRHLEILRHCGVSEATLVTGYREDLFHEALGALGANDFVTTFHNPDFREGSVVSLWCARQALMCGEDILLMDADVLYDARLLSRLVETSFENCFLMDRDFEDGEEPVKLCVRDGKLVDFHKRVKNEFDFCGESVGFFRLSPDISRQVAQASEGYVQGGRRGEWYEETLRDVLIGSDDNTFGYEDVTGLPWIEIDFAEDVVRAQNEILPNLKDHEADEAKR